METGHNRIKIWPCGYNISGILKRWNRKYSVTQTEDNLGPFLGVLWNSDKGGEVTLSLLLNRNFTSKPLVQNATVLGAQTKHYGTLFFVSFGPLHGISSIDSNKAHLITVFSFFFKDKYIYSTKKIALLDQCVDGNAKHKQGLRLTDFFRPDIQNSEDSGNIGRCCNGKRWTLNENWTYLGRRCFFCILTVKSFRLASWFPEKNIRTSNVLQF